MNQKLNFLVSDYFYHSSFMMLAPWFQIAYNILNINLSLTFANLSSIITNYPVYFLDSISHGCNCIVLMAGLYSLKRNKDQCPFFNYVSWVQVFILKHKALFGSSLSGNWNAAIFLWISYLIDICKASETEVLKRACIWLSTLCSCRAICLIGHWNLDIDFTAQLCSRALLFLHDNVK